MNDYENEYGKAMPEIRQRRARGRPKVEGELKEWDIRLTPSDQAEVNFGALDLTDFKILLVCKEGAPNGQPRLHYHMYATTTRSDNYLDTLLNKLGKATDDIKGNAIFSKRKKHEGTIGYVVKNGDVVLRHGIDDQFLTEIFKKSENYRKEKESARKRASRGEENFMGLIMKDADVKRQDDPYDLTKMILQKYKDAEKRLPHRSQVESAVMTLMYNHNPDFVIRHYARAFVQF